MKIEKGHLKYFKVLLFIFLVCTFHSYSCKLADECDKSAGGEKTKHIRIVSWNIEHLGKRSPLRTTAQRKLVGERMLGMNAEIFILQEIDDDHAFATIVNQMNELSENNWISFRNGKQNAIVFNATKVEIVETPNHWSSPGTANYPNANTRPPVTLVFKSIEGNRSFRVIGIHAHPNIEQIRIAQAKWLQEKITGLLNDHKETRHIILCGDYNTGGHLQDGLLQVLREVKTLFNVPKENGPGTGWEKREESDYFSATSSAMAKIKSGTCYVFEPEKFNESFMKFEETYSDHFPVFVDCLVQ